MKIAQKFLKSVSKVVECDNLETLYKVSANEACNLFSSDSASIFIGEEGKLKRVYSTLPTDDYIKPREKGKTQTTYETRELNIVTKKSLQETDGRHIAKGIKGLILIPLINNKSSIGVVVLNYKDPIVKSESPSKHLKLYGSIVGSIIHQKVKAENYKNEIKMLQMYISMASHELKTPITTVKSYSSLIKKNLDNGKPLDKKWATVLSRETSRLHELVDEFLHQDVLSQEELKFNKKKRNIKKILDRAINSFTVVNNKHHLSIVDKTSNQKIQVNIDDNKILQAINNILNNAAKFSEDGSVISIKIEKIGNEVLLSITDKGEGIDSADIPHIFKGQFRGSEVKKPGMGLGLFITKRVVDNHEGNIEVHSVKGKGTTFNIKLPIVYE